MSRWFRARRSNLRRLSRRAPRRRPQSEWGMAGRHRRRVRRAIWIGAAGGVVLVAGAGGWFFALRDTSGQVELARPPAPKCASAKLPGDLGRLAWVSKGRLLLFDMDTCRRRTLVPTGATSPVRFPPAPRAVPLG